MSEEELTHLDDRGRARMVDVGEKGVTRRSAAASAAVCCGPAALEAFREGKVPKGDAAAAARIAGIQAAKRTHELIPLCHPLRLTRIEVDVRTAGEGEEEHILITARVGAEDRTGVEMEALTAAAVAALTVYDMLKGVDRGMVIGPVQLEEKQGGRSGHWVRSGPEEAEDG
ncbi:MAG: cyclic pyranopterin monophosphate synthase MoaC [bacterium]